MAYKVSSEVVSLFKSCYRQIAKIQVLGIEGLDEIKESDILQGGLTIDRYCFSSNALEIGTAIASEATLELKNADGRFDGYTFDGAKLIIKVGIKKWNAKSWENAIMHYVPLGVFTIDEKTKNKSNITLNALDNMVKFDREYDTTLAFPATLGEIVEDACSRCGVLLKTTSFYNSDYVVNARPTDDGLTYRQVIQWAAQLSCTNAFIDWDGQLRLTWFEDSGHIIPAADRYDSDMEEHSVLITGVKVTAADESEYTAGEKGSVLCIEGNSLAQSDAETIAKIIYAKVGNFTYLPYSSVCRPMPYLYPMDMITFVDRRGNEHKTIVSAVTYTMNGTTDVVGEGDGSTKGGYASTGSTTTHEKVIIEKAKKAAEKTSTGQFNVALALNETIGSAFGLYRTEIIENKVSTWYYHDKATLNDSTIIYVFNSGGFAWTEDWNDGNPVWQYGFTKDGNALYKILSTYKIQTEYLDAGCVTAEKLSVEYKQSVIDEISGAETRVTQSFQAADGILSSKISEKAAQADLDDLTGRVSTAETSIEQNAKEIKLKATQTSVDALGNTVSAQGTQITQNAQAITLKAAQADLDDLTGRVSTAESTISVQGNRIALVVDSSNSIKAASIVTAINGSASTVKISANHVDIDGILTISNIATTDDIPTNTSDLTNDSGFQTRSGVTTIIGDTITTGYIEGLGCEFASGKIGGWIVANGWLKSDGSENGVYCGMYSGAYKTDAHYTCNKPSLVNPGSYSNGRFYAGASSSEKVSDSKFTVLDDGSLYAEAAKISGVFSNRGSSGYGLEITGSQIDFYSGSSKIGYLQANTTSSSWGYNYGKAQNSISCSAMFCANGGIRASGLQLSSGYGTYVDGKLALTMGQIKVQTDNLTTRYLLIYNGLIVGVSASKIDGYYDYSSSTYTG